MELIDRDHVAELRMLLGPRFAAMTATFASQATTLCDELRAALAAGDADAVARVAHRFKGGAGAIGASAVTDAAGAIERAATRGALDTLDDAVETLAALVAPTLAALDAG
jgi:two-component system sensor histidine kinase/response regulator